MKINLIRHQFGNDATNGMLFIDGVFECYTLEDEIRDVKVYGETAIPYGTYPVEFRKEGGFHNKYSARYGADHFGMLEIKDIPNFKWVLFHSGNTDENSAGCVLVGDTQQDLDVSKDGFIGSSRNAYKKMYDKIALPMTKGEKVTLEITAINLTANYGDSNNDNKASNDDYLTPNYKEKLDQIHSNTNLIKNYITKGIAPL
ncbi:probable peptidase [uncultured Mediterranean phage uvMED]|nr:probable peptidase [uncultured Mediterranean phage uvMED]BAR14873.1 probable peptidase [uncultured Mediterranean phage uvMED]